MLVDAALDYPAHFLLLDQVLVHHDIILLFFSFLFFLSVSYCSAREKKMS